MVLTGIALIAGALLLWRRGGSRKQIALMLVLAAVIAVNVGLWTLPDGNGAAPIDRSVR
jgi:hypothetical protein